jgi:ribosome-binding factor A
MRTFRNLRVGELIREELSKFFIREMDFGAFVTISSVEVIGKLESALVRVSVIPEDKGKEVYERLQKERPSIQFKLGRILNIKPMPRLEFGLIRIEEAEKIEK